MHADFKVNLNSEFFISIAKQELHSFIMLGVVKEDGTNQLLARVGKTNDIDPDSLSQIKMTTKVISSKTLARLADEGIRRDDAHVATINYQAYSINYDQTAQFLMLIQDIEERQLNNATLTIPQNEPIRCYVPCWKDNQLIFHYQALSESWARPEFSIGASEAIAAEASEIKLTNTCRTTALNMVEAVLGFTTNISKYFFSSPKHECILRAGFPDKDSFYILPPPTNVYRNLSEKQQRILIVLYKRLEDIVNINPTSPKTRDKFNAIKKLYIEIVGTNKLNANELLTKIVEHENNHAEILYKHRDPNLLQRVLGIKSATEKDFQTMKKELKKQSNLDLDAEPPSVINNTHNSK